MIYVFTGNLGSNRHHFQFFFPRIKRDRIHNPTVNYFLKLGMIKLVHFVIVIGRDRVGVVGVTLPDPVNEKY